MTTPAELGQVRDRVRARYAQAASTVTAGGIPSCGNTCARPRLRSSWPKTPGCPAGGCLGGGDDGRVDAGPLRESRTSPGIAGYRIVDRRRRFLLRQTCTAR